MTNLFPRLRRLIDSTSYNSSLLGILLNPLFLIRSGLKNKISRYSSRVQGRVLDFGCGSKPYEGLFTSCQEYVGVDIEKSGHNHADSKVDYYWDGITLPFEDACFDTCVSFEVFEHVFEPQIALAEIRRVLRPGGLLLITTPFAYGEHEIPYDFARYTSYGLRHIVAKAGFVVEAVEKIGDEHLAVGQILIDYVSQRVSRVKYLGFSIIALVAVPIIITSKAISAMSRNNEGAKLYLNLLAVARK
jgi:SAM-dependent methyltransferase